MNIIFLVLPHQSITNQVPKTAKKCSGGRKSKIKVHNPSETSRMRILSCLFLVSGGVGQSLTFISFQLQHLLPSLHGVLSVCLCLYMAIFL